MKVGVAGDSRFAGSNATLIGTNDMRAILQAGSYTYTRVAVGPADDGSGTASAHHFAHSGYLTRTWSSNLGLSPRTPGVGSLDQAVGVGKLFNDTQIWHLMVGINELDTVASAARDWVDEVVRIVEYLVTTQQAQAGITPGFVLYTEPATGITTTGLVQRTIRARDRGYRIALAHLNTLTTVKLVDTNDATYYP